MKQGDRGIRIGLHLIASVIVVFLIVPTLIVIPMSFSPSQFLEFPPSGFSLRWYEEFLTNPKWTGPTLLSISIAFWTAAIATVIGTATALALVRGRLRFKPALNTVVIFPLTAPIIVVAVAVLSFYLRVGLNGTMIGFVLAHTVLATPYVVLVTSAALQRFDWSLELAALNLGATPLQSFLRVVLPAMVPAALVGAVFAFITSFDEAVVAFFISDVRQTTLPRRLFESIDFDLSPVIAAIATVITTASVLLLGTAELIRQGMNRRVRRLSTTAKKE